MKRKKKPLVHFFSAAHKNSLSLRRAIKMAGVGFVLGGVNTAWALGLGNLTHHSFVGEPLSGHIAVLDTNGEIAPNEVMIRQVASTEASKNLGLDLVSHHLRLDFQPVLKDGQLVILVKSKQPVAEPFIDFLLELSWSGGQVYREYTLLMDLPPLAAEVSQRSQVQRQSSKKAQTATPPLVKTEPQEVLRHVPFEPGEFGGRYQIQSGDTLSHIAEQWRLGTHHTLKDTEQWLFENNTNAFLNGNRHQLMLGATLNLPRHDNRPVAALEPKKSADYTSSVEQSKSQVPPAHLRTPSDTSPPPVDERGLNLSGSSLASSQPAPSPAKGSLRLGNNATVEASEFLNGASSKNSAPEIQDLIHVTQETADRITRENAELRGRIEDIENSQYIQGMEKLIALQRSEIRALRASIEERSSSVASENESLETLAEAASPAAGSGSLSVAKAGGGTVGDSQGLPTKSPDSQFWLIAVGIGLLSMLVASILSFRLGQRSRESSESSPNDFPNPGAVINDQDAVPHLSMPDSLGDEEIIPLELEETDQEILDEINLLPEDQALFSGLSNREATLEVPSTLIVDAQLEGLDKVSLPSMVAEELDDFSEMQGNEFSDEASSSNEAHREASEGDSLFAAEDLDDTDLSFDLELKEDFLDAVPADSLDVASGAPGVSSDPELSALEANLFKEDRDEVDELISKAMIFASFGDYDKAEEVLINESAHYLDEPRISESLAQFAKDRKKNDVS